MRAMTTRSVEHGPGGPVIEGAADESRFTVRPVVSMREAELRVHDAGVAR
jgi:hypothetical protein